MIKIMHKGKIYRIVKKGRLQEKDLVWNIEDRCFEFPVAKPSGQMVEIYYMVIREVK
jgi:hypothetical protein